MKIISEKSTSLKIGRDLQILSDSGESLAKSIRAIDVQIRPNDIVSADVFMCISDIQMTGVLPKYFMDNPDTGETKRVKSIQFTDGTEWEAK